MGFLESRRQRAEERRREQAAEEAQRAYADWYADHQELKDLRDHATEFTGVTNAESPELPVVLKKGERAFFVGQGAALIEPRRGRGQYVGGYAGFSFRVMKGVRFHTGSSRGTYIPGEETPTPIDEGTVTITNQRVVFQGTKQAREWAFAKVLGVQHDPALPWTSLHVSNRQKVSGILYDEANMALVRFRLSLAIAHFQGDLAGFVTQLDRELAEHRSLQPPYPGTQPVALIAG